MARMPAQIETYSALAARHLIYVSVDPPRLSARADEQIRAANELAALDVT